MDRRKPELLCPAGDMEKLRMAVAYGADAVYLAGTSFGMRSFTANFTPDELPQAIKLAHDAGVKVHCTVNIMPRNDEAAALPVYLEQLDAAGNLRFALGAAYDAPAAAALLTELGLGEVGGKRVHDWSGGMKRRLALARALLAPSDALALDEPFTGLDADNRAAARRCIERAAQKKLVLLVSHEDDGLVGAEVRL